MCLCHNHFLDMEDTFSEYQEWLGDSVDPKTERGYSRALDILREIMPLEDRLVGVTAFVGHIYMVCCQLSFLAIFFYCSA